MGTAPGLMVLLGVLLAVVGVSAAARPAPLPHRLMVFVAVPAGVTVDYGLADAARHETDVAIAWIEAQVGRQIDRGPDFTEIVTLDVPPDGLRGDPEVAFDRVLGRVQAHVGDEAIFPVILADVRTDADDATVLTCGMGGRLGVVMWLRNCTDRYLSTTAVWGSAASITIAHELVHGLGAVEACAPHATPDGHVDDDPSDILHVSGGAGRPPGPITMDAGRDDYLRHGIPGCPDIADSPLWR